MGIGGSKKIENGTEIIEGFEISLTKLNTEFEKNSTTESKISDFYNIVDGVPVIGQEIAYSDFLGKDYRPDPPSSVEATPDWAFRTTDGQSTILVAAIPGQSGNTVTWEYKTVTYGTRGRTWSAEQDTNSEYTYSTAASNFDYNGSRYYGFTADGTTYYVQGTAGVTPNNSTAFQSRTTTQEAVIYPNAALKRSEINTIPYNGAGMYDTLSNVTLGGITYDIFDSTNSNYSGNNIHLCSKSAPYSNSDLIYYYTPYQAAYYSQEGPMWYSNRIWLWTRNTTTSNIAVDETFDEKGTPDWLHYWRQNVYRNMQMSTLPSIGQRSYNDTGIESWKVTEFRYVPYPGESGTQGTYEHTTVGEGAITSYVGSDGLTHSESTYSRRLPTTSGLYYTKYAFHTPDTDSLLNSLSSLESNYLIEMTEGAEGIESLPENEESPQEYTLSYTPHPKWVPEYVHQNSNDPLNTSVNAAISYTGSTQWLLQKEWRYVYEYNDGSTKSECEAHWYWASTNETGSEVYTWPKGTLVFNIGGRDPRVEVCERYIYGLRDYAGNIVGAYYDNVWFKRGLLKEEYWVGPYHIKLWDIAKGELVSSLIRIVHDGVLQHTDRTIDSLNRPTDDNHSKYNVIKTISDTQYNQYYRGTWWAHYYHPTPDSDSSYGNADGYSIKYFYESLYYKIRRQGTYTATTWATNGTLEIWWGNSRYVSNEPPNHTWYNVEYTDLDNAYYVGNDYFTRGDYIDEFESVHQNKISKFTYVAEVTASLGNPVYYDPDDTSVVYSFSPRNDYEKIVTPLPEIPSTPAYTLGDARESLYSAYDTNPDSWTSSPSYSLNWFSGRNFTNKTQNGYYLSTIRGTTTTPSVVIESNTKTKATLATGRSYITNTNEDLPQRLDFTINAPADDTDKSLLAAYGLYRIDSSSNSEYSLGYILPEQDSYFSYDSVNDKITIYLEDDAGYYRLSWKGYQNVSLSFKGQEGINYGTPGTLGKEFSYSYPFPTISISKLAGAGKAGVDLYLEKRVIHTPGYDSDVWAVVRCADLFEYGSEGWCINSYFLDMFPNGL